MVNDSLRAILCVVLCLIFGVSCQGQTAMDVMERCNRVASQHGRYELEVNGKVFNVFQKVLASGDLASKSIALKNGDYSLTVGGERFEVFLGPRLIIDGSCLDATNRAMVKDLFEGKANNFEVGPFVLAGEDAVFGIKCWKITRTFDAKNAHSSSALSDGGIGDVSELENYVAKDTFRIHAMLAKDAKGRPLLTMRYSGYKDIELDDGFFALPGEFEKVNPKSIEEYFAVLRYANDVKPRAVRQHQHIRVSAKDMKGGKGQYNALFPHLPWTLGVVGFVVLAFFSLKVADIVLSTGSKIRKRGSHDC